MWASFMVEGFILLTTYAVLAFGDFYELPMLLASLINLTEVEIKPLNLSYKACN